MTFADGEPFAYVRSLLPGEEASRLEFTCQGSLFERVHRVIQRNHQHDETIQFRADGSVVFTVNGPEISIEHLAQALEAEVDLARRESLWPGVGLPVTATSWEGETVYLPAASLSEATGIVSGSGPDGRHDVVLRIEAPITVVRHTSRISHLLIGQSMPWRAYKRLIKALAKAEVISPGFARESIRRGRTYIQHDLRSIP